MIGRASHYLKARFLPKPRRARYFEAISSDLAELHRELEGRSVALVGNARTLTDGQGAAIDAHDIVVRMNAAPALGSPARGARVDWLAAGIPVAHIAARRYLWMSWKTWRVPYPWVRSGRLYIYPEADRQRLIGALGARPSTGAMCADLMARSPVASVTFFGFDFFSSLSLSSERRKSEGPHDFDTEGAWITALVERDPRFSIVRP